MIKSFEQVCPQAQFKLLNGDYHDINTWLEEGSIDIGFVTMPDYPKNCRGIALNEDRLLAVLPKEHPLAGNSSFPVAAVENESFISIMENSANDARRALDMAGVKAHVKYTTKDDYAVIAMVEQGLGISIMPELLLGGLTHNVKLMPLDNPRQPHNRRRRAGEEQRQRHRAEVHCAHAALDSRAIRATRGIIYSYSACF